MGAPGGWQLDAKLQAPTPLLSDEFGSVLSISADGRTLAIGADQSGTPRMGTVYVFVRRLFALELGFPDEFRFQLHRPNAVDLAVDVVITLNQSDVLHLRAHLHDQGGALHLQVLDHSNGITVSQFIAHRIPDDTSLLGRLLLRDSVLWPLMCALGADIQLSVFVSETRIAPRAAGKVAHSLFTISVTGRSANLRSTSRDCAIIGVQFVAVSGPGFRRATGGRLDVAIMLT